MACDDISNYSVIEVANCFTMYSVNPSSSRFRIIPYYDFTFNPIDEIGTFEAGQTFMNTLNVLRVVKQSGTKSPITVNNTNIINVGDRSFISSTPLNTLSRLNGAYLNIGTLPYKVVNVNGNIVHLDNAVHISVPAGTDIPMSQPVIVNVASPAAAVTDATVTDLSAAVSKINEMLAAFRASGQMAT